MVINKYIPTINALNKTYTNAVPFVQDIIGLMNTVGFYKANGNAQPQLYYLTTESANQLIKYLEFLPLKSFFLRQSNYDVSLFQLALF